MNLPKQTDIFIYIKLQRTFMALLFRYRYSLKKFSKRGPFDSKHLLYAEVCGSRFANNDDKIMLYGTVQVKNFFLKNSLKV